MPGALFGVGRAGFLRAMLARPRIFLTVGLAPLEARGRQNLTAELVEVEAASTDVSTRAPAHPA